MIDHYTDHLSDYLDEELPVELRNEVALHLEGCAGCRETLEDLRRVAARARALGAEESGSDQWPAIAARLNRKGPLAARPAGVRRRVALSLPQLALAASLLVAVTSGSTLLAIRGLADRHAPAAGTTPPVTMIASSGTVPVQPAGLVAGKEYDEAVAELRAVLEQGRTRLDSTTVAVLERSLARIDRAIAQAEQALAADPGNAYLSGHLAHTRLRKLDLLHRAATLATRS
jgi:hypothetical protein